MSYDEQNLTALRSLITYWPCCDKIGLSGFPTKRDSSQSPQLQRLARKNEISPVARLDKSE